VPNVADPLCEERAQHQCSVASLRARFVAAFKDIGPSGWPILAARLERLDATSDATLVDDLLRAVPLNIVDDGGAKVVERFTTHEAPMVRRSAATALANLAGPSARNVLLGLVMGKDDGVRLGALAGLRRIKAIDAEVVQCLDKVVDQPDAAEELRAAAVASLVDANATARAKAVEILTRVVRPQRKSFVGRLAGALGSHESSMMLVAAARSLLTLGGPEGKEAVLERIRASSGSLKQQLEMLK
jgi:HEAT repeat protein